MFWKTNLPHVLLLLDPPDEFFPKKPLESLWLTLDGFKGIEIIQVGTSGLDPSIPGDFLNHEILIGFMTGLLISRFNYLHHPHFFGGDPEISSLFRVFEGSIIPYISQNCAFFILKCFSPYIPQKYPWNYNPHSHWVGIIIPNKSPKPQNGALLENFLNVVGLLKVERPGRQGFPYENSRSIRKQMHPTGLFTKPRKLDNRFGYMFWAFLGYDAFKSHAFFTIHFEI